ncbi:FAD-binding oxidoreductase [Paractinoplanes toevensis]|uniref:FAD-linked oxidase n=1 Tax=Paractinoplanes toevensis TaxID=571911 RepID=A0A919TBN0_9ACTN|nr:FAD-binding oxidoreductase [Actinoplanes toevensis]GIM92595.1 FAD-linked oxidase [Actinoplanes toevensis]
MTSRPAGLARLRESLNGRLAAPGDPDYEAGRGTWNADVDRRPALIAWPADAGEVASVVRHAHANGLAVAVRGGGHSHAGFGVADDAVVIDLSELSHVGLDAAGRSIRVGGGVRWGAVDELTQAAGLVVTGADVPEVGVAGTALGGGLGWLQRSAGLTADNLLEAEVVLADGTAVRADRASHPDLFWALRGGGGSFGVVTGLQLRVHPLRRLTGLIALHPLDRAQSWLDEYAVRCATLSRSVAVRLTLGSAPPAPFVPEPWRFRPVLMVVAAALGDAAAELDGLSAIGEPIVRLSRALRYTELQEPAGRVPRRQRARGRSAFVTGLGDGLVADLIEAAGSAPSPFSMIQIQLMGGAIADVDASASAVPYRWAAHHVAAHALAAPDDPADLDSWAELVGTRLGRHGTGGPYVNFVTGTETAGDVRRIFGEAGHARLASVKQAYDRDDVFRCGLPLASVASPA